MIPSRSDSNKGILPLPYPGSFFFSFRKLITPMNIIIFFFLNHHHHHRRRRRRRRRHRRHRRHHRHHEFHYILIFCDTDTDFPNLILALTLSPFSQNPFSQPFPNLRRNRQPYGNILKQDLLSTKGKLSVLYTLFYRVALLSSYITCSSKMISMDHSS